MIKALLFVLLLVITSVHDARTREIPNILPILIAATGLIPPISPVAFLGILSALPLLIAGIAKEGSIGGGDVKLMAAAGSFLGLSAGLFSLCAGLLCAVLFYAAAQLVARLRKQKRIAISAASLPLAPFLSLGCVLSLIT